MGIGSVQSCLCQSQPPRICGVYNVKQPAPKDEAENCQVIHGQRGQQWKKPLHLLIGIPTSLSPNQKSTTTPAADGVPAPGPQRM